MNENELQANLNAILADKQVNLLPQNLKAGVTLLGVTGTIVDGGIDTADADAVAEDLSYGKTAYVNGEKITGVLKSDGVYNIIQQVHEPETKAGIWIRGDNTNIEQVYFSGNSTVDGDFLPSSNYSYLSQSDKIYCEVIMNGYMYRFGIVYASSTYKIRIKKYNLTTKQYITYYDSPSLSSGYSGTYYVWAFAYQGNIVVCYNEGGLKYRMFYPATGSFGSSVSITGNINTTDLYQYIVQLVGDKIYCYYRAYYERNDNTKIFDIPTNTLSVGPAIGGLIMSYQNRYTNYTTIGNDIYVMDVQSTSFRMVKSTLGTAGTDKTIANVPAMGVIYGFGNYVYLFPKGNNLTTYYKYDTINDSWETKTSDVKFTIDCTLNYYGFGGMFASFDSLSGILYICKESAYVNAFQLDTSSDIANLNTNTLVVNVSQYGSDALMKNLNNLVVSVGNTGIVKETGGNKYLDASHMLCVGDGVNWHYVKNPESYTSTITYDCAGGSTISPHQVICGSVIPTPTPPTKYHYLFKEWLWNGEPYDFRHLVIDDMELVATWNDAVIVTFDYDDGTSTSQTILVGAKATKPSLDPTKDWNEFLGWSLNGVPFDFNTAIYNDITLTPIWGTIQEVNYVYSTGTQYIDTGVVPKSTTRVVVDVSYPEINGTVGTGMGWYSSSSAETLFFGVRNSNGIAQFYSSCSANYQIVDSGVEFDTRRHIFDLQSGSQKLDGVEYGTDTIGDTGTSGQTMWIFKGHQEWLNDKDQKDLISNAIIYNYKIYQNGLLTHNLIPCKTYNNEYALYNSVTKKVMRNQGFGELFGPGKSYTPIEYLQSNGNAYINTFVRNRSDARFITEMSASGTDIVCGGEYSSSYSFRWGLNGSGIVYFGYNGSNRTTSVYGSLADYYKYDMKSGAQAIYNAGGTQLISYTSTMSTYCNSPIYLFRCANDNGTNFGNNTMRIKSFKYYRGNTLFLDLIPALDENNVPCMYDTLFHGYYYSQTSNQFIIPSVPTYTQISYLQTTGTQWFNTGITNSSSVKLMMEYNLDKYWKNDGIIFGGRDSTSSNAFMLFSKYLDPKSYFWYYRSTNITSTTTNDYFGKDVTLSATNGVVTLADGINTENISITGQSTFTGSTKLTIFNGQTSSSSSIMENNCMTGKIYHIQVWVNNALQRDYIPVKDENDVVCLYDRIWNTYLYHNGRGELLDHSLNGFESADYIDTYGNQYIKTGVKPTQNTKVEIKAKLLKDNYFDGALFGCQNSSTTNNRMGLWFNGLSRQIVLAPFMGSQSLRYVNKFNADTDYTFILDSSGLNVNGEQIASWTVPNFTCTDELTLFAISGKSTDEWKKFIGRVYYCKIWENGVLIRNFVPKIDCSGNAIMYDNVNGNYYAPFGGGMCTAGLPNGYTQVPYIRNVTKNCLIDSGFKPNNKTRVCAAFEVMDFVPWALYWGTCGGYTGTTKNKGYYMDNANSITTLVYASEGSSCRNSSLTLIGPHLIDCDVGYAVIDGASLSLNNETRQSDYNLTIFDATGYEGQYHSGGMSDMKLFNFAIYDNGLLIRNYVPCYRNSDGRAGVYDTVNNTFTGNYNYDRTDDDFYYGNNTYNELAYLDGGYGRYIDTGVKPNQTISLHMQLCGTENYGFWAGVWDTSSNNGAYGICNQGGSIWTGYGNQGGNNGSALSNGVHSISFDTKSVIIDGSAFKTFSANDFQLNNNLYLFVRNEAGTPVYYADQASGVRMRDTSIVLNGKVCRNFIPSIRKSDNKPGFLDVINNVFYTNAGLREFGYQEIGTSSTQQSDYTEVNYIRSSGGQYIDTGLKGNQNTKVEISFCAEALPSESLLYGTRESGAETNFSMFIGTNSLNQRVGNQAIQRPSGFWSNNTDYVVIQDKTGQTVNGTFTAYSGTPSDFTSTYNMLICNIGNYTGTLFTGKIYYVKIWDNNVLVRDFQPIRITQSGEYCLLDKVNNTIYHNAGSGHFTGEGGEVVEPIKTLYAQTNGSQYIDTLVRGDIVGKFDTKFQIMSRSSGNYQSIIYEEQYDGSKYCGVGIRANSSNNFCFNHAYQSTPVVPVATGIDYHIVYDVVGGTGMINDTSFVCNPPEEWDILNMYLFANNANGSSSQNMSVRLYYMKIYDRSNNLIRDFMPCVDENHTICLYDKVEKVFYYVNSGTMAYGSIDWSYIDEEEAQIVGSVLNNILGTTGDISEGSYETEVEPVLDDILGGVI